MCSVSSAESSADMTHAVESEPQDIARFGVLGSLVIWQGRRTIHVPAAKHRAVLAVLLIHANEQIAVETLVDELWPDAPPETARKTVQGYVWRLRRALGGAAGQVETVNSGYRLVVPRDGSDLQQFERAIGDAQVAALAGQSENAADLLARSLRLWRGPAFAGVARTPLVEAHAARMAEAKLAAHELRISTRLEINRHSEVIPELVGLVTEYPGRESLYRLLMTALYRAGRRLDALEVFERLRRTLGSEYGLDPDQETVALQQAVLRGSHTPVSRHWAR